MGLSRSEDIFANPDEISLQSPPHSPILPQLDLFSTNHTGNTSQANSRLDLDFSPQKRRKTGYTRTTKPKYFINNPLGDSPSQATLPLLDSISLQSIDYDQFSSSSNELLASNIQEIPTHAQDTGGFYNEFVEAVLVNAMPFFSITRDIFVTQGWDSKNGQSSVSVKYILLNISLNLL